jgi:hypothetical protein
MTKTRLMLGIGLLSLTFCFTAAAQNWAASGNTLLSLNIPVRAEIVVADSTTNLTETVAFGNLTGTTNYSYRIRTSKTGGTGKITFTIKEFTPADKDGPMVSQLLYTTTAGAAASSKVTTAVAPSTSGDNAVAGFGANAKTTSAGESGTVNWTLQQPANTPYPAGTGYTSSVTFNISAT